MSRRSRVPAKWIRTEADRAAVGLGYYFDQSAADFVCNFFTSILKLTIGRWKGEPFLLQPWQVDYLSRLYGWMRPDGTRRFRESYLEVPKKNGKTSIFAGLGVFSLIEEPTAEVYLGAVNSLQSAIIYREVCRMIAAAPDLRAHLRPGNKRFVTFAENDAFLEALTAEIEAKDGANASATFLDEVHRYPNSKIYDIFKHAGEARDQPLLACLTTAGTDKDSLCGRLHNRTRAIEAGDAGDLEFLGVIYAADETDDLDDPRVWRKANPSMGSILKEYDFKLKWEAAKRIPSERALFKRLRFGIWTPDTSPWLPMDLWDAAADPAGVVMVPTGKEDMRRATFDPAWWKGRKVYIGGDFSSVRDLTALVMVTMDGDLAQWHSWYFMPERTKRERAEQDGVPYPDWIDQGWMIQTEGKSTEYGTIRRVLNDLRDWGVDIQMIGFDPWNAGQIGAELIEDGFQTFMIGQNFSNLTAPCKELERRLLNGRLAHDGNPVTRWCAKNVVVVRDAMENIKPSKVKSGSKNRIDGIAAGVMALGMATKKLGNAQGGVAVA